jgi:EmrB/QacA subfamily drug resistance transporter
MTESGPAGSTPLPRRSLILAACMMATFMVAIESSIVGTALPTIVAELGGFRLFTWVFGASLLAQAVTVPIYGRLADLYGRKRVFFGGTALFLVGSILSGCAWGMLPLVVFRALQGLGAGALQPVAYTIVADIYTPSERARIQGWLSGVFGVAGVFGPALGAFLVEHGSWRAVFWLNVPIGIATIAMLARLLPEQATLRRHRVDYLGSALLMLGAGAVMVALVQMQSLDATTLALLAGGGLLALVVLVVHERRAPEPMVPLALWGRRIIAVGNLGALTIGAVMMGPIAFLPTYVQGAMGYGPAAAGSVIAAMSISWAVASVAAGRLMVRTSYRRAAVVGGVMLVAGSAMLIALEPARGPWWAGAGAFVIGVGMGYCNTAWVVSIQASVAWRERGVATSSVLFMRTVGQSLGTALFGALFNLGIATRVGEVGDAIDRLMEPTLRRSLDAAEIARLVAAIAGALDGVYLVVGVLSVVALVLPLWMPSGFGPRHQVAEPREAEGSG